MTTRLAQANRYLTPKRLAFLQMFKTKPCISIYQAYDLRRAETESQRRATRWFLKGLYRAGYLLREWSTDPGDVSLLPHPYFTYRLSKHGAQVVHGRASVEKAPSSMTHEEEITQFHMALETLGRELWWKQHDLKKTVNPDAVFGLKTDQGRSAYFFLEIERTRQGLSRNDHKGVLGKLEKYDALRRTPRCRKDWEHFDDFRTIWVVPASGRHSARELADNLLKRLSEKYPYRWIWVTTDDEYRADIGGAIFKTPRDFSQVAYSLLDV